MLRKLRSSVTRPVRKYITVYYISHTTTHTHQTGTMAYIPSHLYYIMFELLKNSMRAVAEFHGDDEDSELPPVKIIIGSGKESEDVVIKISDLGGGIPRSHNKRIFNYLFTTAAPAFQTQLIEEMESFGRSSLLRVPLARYQPRQRCRETPGRASHRLA